MTKIYTTIAEGLARLKEVEQRSLAAYLADWKTMAITVGSNGRAPAGLSVQSHLVRCHPPRSHYA